MIRPSSSRKPNIEPTTIPAIAPPLKPECEPLPLEFEPPAPPVLVADDVALALVEEKTSAMEEKTGRVTSWHRPCALDVKQHESVAFSVLARQ